MTNEILDRMEAITAANQGLINAANSLAEIDNPEVKKYAYEILVAASEIAAAGGQLLLKFKEDADRMN